MTNILTIDVEDYWSVFSKDWLHRDIPPTDAVARNTEWFLETLQQFNVKATFFVLADIAQHFPGLVRTIAQNGHEIASHGSSHTQIFKLTEEKLRDEINKCKELLEDIIGQPVTGYRAPAFSITPNTQWALEVLAEQGFEYDSSIFPIAGKRYGWPGFSKGVCNIELPSGRSIVEVPLSTVTLWRKSLPAAGGGYLRHLPYSYTQWAVKRIQKERPVIVYMHPYEIDTDATPIDTAHLSANDQQMAVKHHKMQLRNRATVAKKFVRLLTQFQFTTMRDLLKNPQAILPKEAL